MRSYTLSHLTLIGTQAIIDGDRSHFIHETAITERLRMYMKSHNYSLAEAEPEFYTFVRSLGYIPPKEFRAEFPTSSLLTC